MRYDLGELVRQQKRRRRSITVRPIELSASMSSDLARLAREVVAAWAIGARDQVLPAYAGALSGMVRDGATDALSASIEAIAEGLTRLVIMITPQVRDWAIRVERVHRGRYVSSIRAATGVDVSALIWPADAADEIAAAIEWASSLIRDLSASSRRRLEQAVYSGVARRAPTRDIAKEIAEALSIERRRAERIAIDQTLKLAGNLDRMRQQEAGIEEYRWRHSGKLHPRPEHVAREGKVFNWNEPPPDGHPRSQPNCGCVAQAYIDLLDEG